MTRLPFAELSRYGLSDLDLAPCCRFVSGDMPYFILCQYHEGFFDGYDAAFAKVESNQPALPASTNAGAAGGEHPSSDAAAPQRSTRGLHFRRRE